MSWQQLAVTLLTSSIVATAVSAILTSYNDRRAARWEAKRQACLEALAIVDAVWAHIGFREAGSSVRVLPQPRVSIADIRRCHSLLILTCDHPEVAERYLQCMNLRGATAGDGGMTADSIAALRDVIRRELGFRRSTPSNRERAWLANVPGATEHRATEDATHEGSS